MSQMRWPAGGGNIDINPKCDLLFDNKSLSMTELADSSATATDTFDGGGAGLPSVALSHQQREYYGEHVRRTERADEEEEDLDVEESRFNEFAIGTLNQHQHHHHHQLTTLSHPHVEKSSQPKESTGMIMVRGAVGDGEGMAYDKVVGRTGREGREEEVDQVVASSRKRPPPVMVPTTQDEIDDERIFYDIVDSKHLISRLGSSGLPRPGGLMMGLSLAAFSAPQQQRGGSEAPSSSSSSSSKSAPSNGGGGVGGSAKGQQKSAGNALELGFVVWWSEVVILYSVFGVCGAVGLVDIDRQSDSQDPKYSYRLYSLLFPLIFTPFPGLTLGVSLLFSFVGIS